MWRGGLKNSGEPLSELSGRSIVKTKLTVSFQRQSVCAADDVDAPHETSLSFDQTTTVGDALRKIGELQLLPRIEGGKATWIAVGKNPLAVLAQEWPKARTLVEESSLLQDHLREGKNIFFRYLAQESPEIVFEREKMPEKFD
jgi:hypothetical protein